ncbi:MAG: hypothetical protein LBV12_12355 [Puniceicoccales bacterium]|nr:hypothetical protein [Puniceicoccales bacterium]
MAAFRAKVNDPIRRCDHFKSVLHNDDGISLFYKLIEQIQQAFDILMM